MKSLNLKGQTFGRLHVEDKAESKNGRTYWNCRCECGNKKTVSTQHLRSGTIQSCGCYRLSQLREKLVTHGMSGSRLYSIWGHMKCRIKNPKDHKYPLYGGRGIRLCESWEDFEPFHEWAIANGYQEDLSIERIDVNGDYCPENCKWIPLKDQAKNRRSNHTLTWRGETKTITEWSEDLDIKPNIIFARIDRYGWDIERALTQKVRRYEGG